MTDGADSGGRYDSNKRLHSTEIMGTETEKAPHAKKSRLEEANIKQKEQIPNEIPDEKNVHIDNIKKRRSSLRRSINGGFTSTLRAACSTIDDSVPPSEKIKRIVELCINHSLLSLRNTEEDNINFIEFEQAITKKTGDILNKLVASGDTAKKQETETRKQINKFKEERTLWNEEFTTRRQAYTEARAKLKDITKGKVTIEKAPLKTEDIQFLKSLPNLEEVNKRITQYQNRHQIGMIELERSAKTVLNSLTMAERKICKAKKVMVPSFAWPS